MKRTKISKKEKPIKWVRLRLTAKHPTKSAWFTTTEILVPREYKNSLFGTYFCGNYNMRNNKDFIKEINILLGVIQRLIEIKLKMNWNEESKS